MSSPSKKPDATATRIGALAQKIINNPTKAMTVTFHSLPASHQWMLFALLDWDRWGDLPTVYERLCPPEHAYSAARVIDELNESFLRTETLAPDTALTEWTHPTCKDLTIAMLADHATQRHWFLGHCGEEGWRIAFAVAAGANGRINLPLLRSARDWGTAQERLCEFPIDFGLELVSQGLKIAVKEEEFDRAALRRLVTHLCVQARRVRLQEWRDATYRLYLFIRQELALRLSTPGIAEHLRDMLDYVSDDRWGEEAITEGFPGAVEDLAKFCQVASKGSPTWWRHLKSSRMLRDALNSLAVHARNFDDTYDEGVKGSENLHKQASAFEELGKALALLSRCVGDICRHDLADLAKACAASASSLRGKVEDSSTDFDSRYERVDDSDNLVLSHSQIDEIFRDL